VGEHVMSLLWALNGRPLQSQLSWRAVRGPFERLHSRACKCVFVYVCLVCVLRPFGALWAPKEHQRQQ